MQVIENIDISAARKVVTGLIVSMSNKFHFQFLTNESYTDKHLHRDCAFATTFRLAPYNVSQHR